MHHLRVAVVLVAHDCRGRVLQRRDRAAVPLPVLGERQALRDRAAVPLPVLRERQAFVELFSYHDAIPIAGGSLTRTKKI